MNWHQWRAIELVKLMNEHPQILEAATRAAAEVVNGLITTKQYEDWMDAIVDPVILCPYCADWEGVSDVTLYDGRFFCCEMCALVPDRAAGR